MITIEKLQELHGRLEHLGGDGGEVIAITTAELKELIKASHAYLRMRNAHREMNVFAASP